MQPRINVSIAINENYIPYAYVMLTSLFENNKDRKVRVYIMYGNIPDNKLEVFEELERNYGQEIYCLQITKDIFPDYLPYTKEWTLEVYYRLLLQEYIPAEDSRILQMDVDMIVNMPLDDLYDMDFMGKSMVVCPDMSVEKNGLLTIQKELLSEVVDVSQYLYFNAGIILFNLDKMREKISFDDFLTCAKRLEGRLFAQDQDLLNYMFHDDILYADEWKYDVFTKIANNEGKKYEWAKKNASVLHFAGRKPWTPDALRYSIEKIWWEYAKKTPFYYSLIEELLLGEMSEEYADTNLRRISKERDEFRNLLMKCQKIIGIQ